MVESPKTATEARNPEKETPLDNPRRETTDYVDRTIRYVLRNIPDFTGKVVFNVNFRNGGIGGVEAFVQKKIK